jgi:hypothetical protein
MRKGRIRQGRMRQGRALNEMTRLGRSGQVKSGQCSSTCGRAVHCRLVQLLGL